MSTQEPNRDQAIDALLREQMRAGAAAGPSDRCLDADTLAAWIDGDLKAADIASAEAHVSTCARCQTMIAALVRATPAVPRTVPWWRRGWVIGSLVPLTAGAMAIAIWIARPSAPDRTAVRSEAPPQSSVDFLPNGPSAARRPATSPGIASQGTAPTYVQPSKPPALRDQNSAPPAGDTRSNAVSPLRTESTNEPIASSRFDQGVAAAPAAPNAPPPVAAARAAAAAEAAEPRITAMQSTALSKHAVAPIEVLSPNPGIRWRITLSGSIERSGNGGATWTASPSGVTEDLLAGAAPSSTVCWIVGRGGTVLLSTDGLQWRRVAFPERVDLAVVQATDASAATITTADNRRFRTADGGQTWTPLQEF